MQLYIIDAFADHLFAGNPAAVCPMDSWPPDELMQQIAFENNLAETAFIVREVERYRIRWFTPSVEVDLCGHATLAAAHVVFHHLDAGTERIDFNSRSGKLSVSQSADLLTLDFPADQYEEVDPDMHLLNCFLTKPQEVYKGKTDYMFVFASQQEVEQVPVNFDAIRAIDARGMIITAPGTDTDFVSRFFAPQSGIKEDPVTGSAHTTLAPYWSQKLDKKKLTARQLSRRGGHLICELKDDRVLISGKAFTYLKGEIETSNLPPL